MFQNFAYLLKINKSSLRGFDYFVIDSKMKLFFPIPFLFISKKITSLLQPTDLYLHL